ncbi:MAG: hypothetical protein ACI80V_001970 [Rhodothermales bacterium]|jgi:hypothetical protein
MAYLCDELEAQKAVITLVPEVIWDAKPPGDSLSLREMYQRMLQRECTDFPESIGRQGSPVSPEAEPIMLLEQIAVRRAANVETVQKMDTGAELLKTCHRLIQADTDSLREVGIRLNETSMGTPRTSRL